MSPAAPSGEASSSRPKASRAAAGSRPKPGKDGAARRRERSLGSDGERPARGIPASQRALRRQGKETMRKLLDAAFDAFSTRGYHATRVNDIVELARTSHGTFYLYFSNKDDILRALVSDALDEPGEYYPPLVASDGPLSWEGLREWVGHFSARWTRAAPLFRAWDELVGSDAELATRARRTLGSMAESLGLLVDRSGGGGDVDPEVAGAALFAMVERFHSLRRSIGAPITERDLDDLTTIVQRAFFNPPAGNGSKTKRRVGSTPARRSGSSGRATTGAGSAASSRARAAAGRAPRTGAVRRSAPRPRA